MNDFEVGDLVETNSGSHIGVVFEKDTESPPYIHYSLISPWYRVLWNDGDVTDEDGRDMILYKGGDDHGNESGCEKAQESRQESSEGSNDATTCGQC